VYTSAVYTAAMKNITLSADEALIEAARQRAHADHTTLNEAFRQWLAEYAHQRERMRRYDEVMTTLRGSVKVGRKLTRDQRNER
jgi:hypothetical protein